MDRRGGASRAGVPAATGTVGDDDRLGRSVRARLAPPGPGPGRARPSGIGSLASAATRFAAGWGRPVVVRRALAGPAPVHPASGAGEVAPPRWWAQTDALRRSRLGVDDAAEVPRGLPLMVRRVPTEATRRPGAAPTRLVPRTVRVRVADDVRAAGRMLTSADGARPRSARPAAVAAARRATASDEDTTAHRGAVPTPPPAVPALLAPHTATHPSARATAATDASAPALTPAAGAPGSPTPSSRPPGPPTGGRLLRRRALATAATTARATRATQHGTPASTTTPRPTAPPPSPTASARPLVSGAGLRDVVRRFVGPVSRVHSPAVQATTSSTGDATASMRRHVGPGGPLAATLAQRRHDLGVDRGAAPSAPATRRSPLSPQDARPFTEPTSHQTARAETVRPDSQPTGVIAPSAAAGPRTTAGTSAPTSTAPPAGATHAASAVARRAPALSSSGASSAGAPAPAATSAPLVTTARGAGVGIVGSAGVGIAGGAAVGAGGAAVGTAGSAAGGRAGSAGIGIAGSVGVDGAVVRRLPGAGHRRTGHVPRWSDDPTRPLGVEGGVVRRATRRARHEPPRATPVRPARDVPGATGPTTLTRPVGPGRLGSSVRAATAPGRGTPGPGRGSAGAGRGPTGRAPAASGLAAPVGADRSEPGFASAFTTARWETSTASQGPGALLGSLAPDVVRPASGAATTSRTAASRAAAGSTPLAPPTGRGTVRRSTAAGSATDLDRAEPTRRSTSGSARPPAAPARRSTSGPARPARATADPPALALRHGDAAPSASGTALTGTSPSRPGSTGSRTQGVGPGTAFVRRWVSGRRPDPVDVASAARGRPRRRPLPPGYVTDLPTGAAPTSAAAPPPPPPPPPVAWQVAPPPGARSASAPALSPHRLPAAPPLPTTALSQGPQAASAPADPAFDAASSGPATDPGRRRSASAPVARHEPGIAALWASLADSSPPGSSAGSSSSPALHAPPGGAMSVPDARSSDLDDVAAELAARVAELERWTRDELDEHVLLLVERRLEEETERRRWRSGTEVF